MDKARELLKHGRYDELALGGLHCTRPVIVVMVRMLISEFQADTILRDSICGDTPLHMAASCGRGEVALTLITEFGCDANLPNNNGYTSLHRACQYEYASVLATIKHGDTPLHIAASRGHDECVEALLQLDAPIMQRNAAGKTALHLAIESGRSSIVRIFIKHASVFATTEDDDTPLHIAAARGHGECVEALLQLDAPIMQRNAAGKTVLHLAIESRRSSIVIIFMKHVLCVCYYQGWRHPSSHSCSRRMQRMCRRIAAFGCSNNVQGKQQGM